MDFDEKFLAKLGSITVNFQTLEETLRISISLLLSGELELGNIVTVSLSFAKCCDLIDGLVRFRVGGHSPIYLEFQDILHRAIQAEQHRNQIVHSVWLKSFSENVLAQRLKVTAKRGKGMQTHLEHVTWERLEQIDQELISAEEAVVAFTGKLFQEGIIPPPAP